MAGGCDKGKKVTAEASSSRPKQTRPSCGMGSPPPEQGPPPSLATFTSPKAMKAFCGMPLEAFKSLTTKFYANPADSPNRPEMMVRGRLEFWDEGTIDNSFSTPTLGISYPSLFDGEVNLVTATPPHEILDYLCGRYSGVE
ncbi:hypothetical protein Droror1_Dr00017937 [Drosera rotundifolia]